MKHVLLATPAGAAPRALAHEGHGLTGSHWHASDAWGLVASGMPVATVFWIRRGK